MIKSLAALAVVALAALLFLGNYHIVKTDNGTQLIGKEKFALSQTWVDTRDWSPLDYAKNPHISKELVKEKANDIVENVKDHWRDIGDSIENFVAGLDGKSDSFSDDIKELKEDARAEYEALKKKLEKKNIDMDKFKQEVSKLRDRVETQLRALKQKIEKELENN